MRRRSTSLCLFLLIGLFAFIAGCEEKSDADKAADAIEGATTPPPATQADG